MKKVIVSVTNDLVTDQRVHKVCMTLYNMGFSVLLVGRKQKKSLPLHTRAYATKRMKLLFNKGSMFYANYNFRLFVFLLFHKAYVLVANDLDTLLANFLISRLKKATLVYDSHEYFTEVPELQGRKLVQNIWKSIERFIFPQLKYVFTVNESIAKLYQEEYKVEVKVLRNVPILKHIKNLKSKKELGIPSDKKIILLQGSGINMDRGAEEAVEAMRYIENAMFIIIGSGDVIGKLKEMTKMLNVDKKVTFIKKLFPEELFNYTVHADIGLTLDKATNINYKFSLPNKLFDYIHAGIPVLASPLPEIKNIFDKYNIGEFIENHSPKHIAEKINYMLSDEEKIKLWKKNTALAAQEYCWENEEKKLIEIYTPFI